MTGDPKNFRQLYVARIDLPYTCLQQGENPYGGVISRGQPVWTENALEGQSSQSIVAFVEGVGMVTLDARWLTQGTTSGQDGDQ